VGTILFGLGGATDEDSVRIPHDRAARALNRTAVHNDETGHYRGL